MDTPTTPDGILDDFQDLGGVRLVDGERARLTSFGVWTVDRWLCQQFDPNAW